MSERLSEARASRTVRSLARAIGRRCRGRTLVLGREFPELMDRLGSQGNEARARGLEAAGDPVDEPWDTVVLVRAIEYENAEESGAVLKRAWQLLGPRGKLLACIPNEDHVEDPGRQQRFTRRGLKELLKTIDQPKIFTDQPLRWLLMCLDADPRVDRPSEERHRVIARLCRGSVLELGCAAGHLAGKIAERGLSVAGVDKNSAKIAKARRLFPGISFTQADILTLSDEPRYDTVVLAEVLEHVPTAIGDQMLARAWDLVAPAGRLVVSVPNEDCVRHANHLREFTQRDLAELLGPLGRTTVVTDQPFRWLLMHVDRVS